MRPRARAPHRRRAERGSVSVLVAVLLPVLLVMTALVVDLGYFFLVRSQLQNTADAAALAGVRDLDGTVEHLAAARRSAQDMARRHRADGKPVELALNEGNAATGDIVLGQWDFEARSFTPAELATPVWRINAVQVTARRSAASGGAVATYFARVFGVAEKDLGATAIAVGGSPRSTCGFPLALPACSIIAADGTLRCQAQLTFGRATSDNVGFTLLMPDPPVNTPGINCQVSKALGFGCSPPCECGSTCNETSLDEGSIYVSNGDNLSQSVVDMINQAVSSAGPEGLFVRAPVLDSGDLDPARCGDFQFNRAQEIAGYVTLRLLGASSGPPKSVTVSVNCEQSGEAPPGGGFFGYKSVSPYLAR